MLDIFIKNWDVLIFKALVVTLQITVVSLIVGILVGLFIVFLSISKIKVFNWIAQLYLAVIRGTPMIVQICILYFGMTSIFTLSQFWAGVIALAVHNAAYISEIFRGTIQSIDKGQMEAARSLGMSHSLGMRRIILPQAIRQAIPPLGNQFIILLKESSLVAYIGMQDLWGTTMAIAGANYRPLDTYIVTGVFYLALVLIFTFMVNKVENRLKYT